MCLSAEVRISKNYNATTTSSLYQCSRYILMLNLLEEAEKPWILTYCFSSLVQREKGIYAERNDILIQHKIETSGLLDNFARAKWLLHYILKPA